MPVLPPLTQTFTVDATDFLAGVDRMIERTLQAADAIDRVAASAARLSESAGTATGSEETLSAAADAVVTALDEQAAALGTLTAAIDDNTAAVDAAAVSAGGLSASAGKTSGTLAALGSKARLAFLGVAAGTAYAVVKAAKFQEELTRLQAAAGLTHVNMNRVSKAMLRIGDATGFTGTQIAEAMYHPVSAGMRLQAALKLVAGAAELAQIHGASLEDTAYTLSSVMKAYNLGASKAGRTTALLNAIVGQGDMRFQDFNQSIKNWAPTGAAMGISIRSMGSAIAYLTDRGNSAEVASTRLTMGLSMITSGSKQANTFLRSLGLTTGSLALRNQTLQQVMLQAGLTTNKVAADLKKPDGIYVALKDVQDAFHRAGLSANQANQVMAKIFGGGRSDKAMMSLLQNLGGIKTKYDSIGHAVRHFGSSWKQTQQTVAFEAKKVWTSIQNLAITFGQILLPSVEKVLGRVARFIAVMQKHPAVAAFAGAVAAVALAIKLVSGAMTVLDGVMDANPIGLVVIAVIALAVGLYELWKHCKLVREIVADVGHFFATAWRASVEIAGKAIRWFENGPLKWIEARLSIFTKLWHQKHGEIEKSARTAWHYVSMIVGWWAKHVMHNLGVTVRWLEKYVPKAWNFVLDVTRPIWRTISAVITTALHVIRDVIALVIDVITGHWHNAWNDLKRIAADIWHGIVRIAKAIFGKLPHDLYTIGQHILHGLIHGIESEISNVLSTVESVGSSIIGSLEKTLGISSPSRVAHYHGLMFARGLAEGLMDGTPIVEAAAGKLATAVRFQPGAFATGRGGHGGGTVINAPIHVEVPGGFIGSDHELATALARAVQPALLRLQKNNPIAQF